MMATGDKHHCDNCDRDWYESPWGHKCGGRVVTQADIGMMGALSLASESLSNSTPLDSNTSPVRQEGFDKKAYQREYMRRKRAESKQPDSTEGYTRVRPPLASEPEDEAQRAKDKLVASVSPQFRERVAVLADQGVRLIL